MQSIPMIIHMKLCLRHDPNLCANSQNTPGITHLLLITLGFFPLRIPTAGCSTCVCVCLCIHVMCFNELTASSFIALCVVCLSP